MNVTTESTAAADGPPAVVDCQGAAPSERAPAPFWASLRRVARQPRFIAAALVLLVSAVGLNAATGFLQLHFRKVAVPLAQSLDDPRKDPLQARPWLRFGRRARSRGRRAR